MLLLKNYFIVLVLLLFAIQSKGQQKNTHGNNIAIYKYEFKNLTYNPYNQHLISLSKTKPKKNWNNYHGGAINTTDSLFFFNNNQLCFSFPTNTDKISNKYLIYYFSLKSIKCPTLFSLLNYYQPIINTNLKANKLPKKLNLIPAVCSAFNPYSSIGIGGEGFWQLNYPQALKYGLRVDEFVDERRDFKKSTQAATHYIKDLYKMYNNWELTLTAYASGVVTVNKLLRRHKATSYKEIYPFLPNETKDFVQAFVAMQYIYNYDNYGAVNLNPIINADTVFIDHKLLFEAINHVIKTKTTDFKFLNPVLNREIFPANFTAYFPVGTKKKFIEFKDSIYFYQDSILLKPKPVAPEIIIPKTGEPFIYTVQAGDVLGLIADKFNIRVAQLQNWNNIDGTRIDIGQELTIYGKHSKVKSQKSKEENPKLKVQSKKHQTSNLKPQTSNGYTTYTVKSGDNLWLIAKKYSGISAQNIMDFNKVNPN